MPQPQIIAKKGNVSQQASVSRTVKYGRKTVSRDTGSHCTAGAGNKTNLVQSVGRNKLLPPASRSQTGFYHRKCMFSGGVRSYGGATIKPYLPVVDTTSKASGTSTCPPTFRVPATPKRSRKSLSMIDLSPGGIDHESRDLRSDSSASRMAEVADRTMENHGVLHLAVLPTNAPIDNPWLNGTNNVVEDDRDEKRVAKAASTICHLLAINAWRRRREEVAALQETVEELGQQVDHLHIQIVVLRRLLQTENCRVEKLSGESHQTKTQLEDASRERDQLKTEKSQLEDELKELREKSEAKSVVAENLRNELMTLKSQLESLDKQISRDREKLLKLREDKKILLEKVSTTESLAGECATRADSAEATIQELQGRLVARENAVETLQQDNRKCSSALKEKEAEKLKLEKRLRLSEDSGRALGLKAANLEMQLGDREAALRRIESAYNSQLTELTEIRERMIRQSQEVGWSSRVLQIAGSVVWAPRAILRSLSFLSNSGSH